MWYRAPSHPRRHGRRRAHSKAPAAILRAGVDLRGSVGHAGVVYLAGASPPAHFGRPVMDVPPCSVFVSLTCGGRLSVRERENSEILLFLNFE